MGKANAGRTQIYCQFSGYIKQKIEEFGSLGISNGSYSLYMDRLNLEEALRLFFPPLLFCRLVIS